MIINKTGHVLATLVIFWLGGSELGTSTIVQLSDVVLLITHVANFGLCEWVVTELTEAAVIRPLIKNAYLDRIIMKNYKPVSNLSQLSKVIEKVVANRLSDYLDS